MKHITVLGADSAGGRGWRIPHGWLAINLYYATDATRIMQWVGGGWQDRTPPITGYNDLSDLAWISDSDVWATEYNWLTNTGPSKVWHWDGAAWSVALSYADVAQNIVAVSSSDVYVFGAGSTGKVTWNHWNGSAWAGWTTTTVASSSFGHYDRGAKWPSLALRRNMGAGQLGYLGVSDFTAEVSNAGAVWRAIWFADATHGWAARGNLDSQLLWRWNGAWAYATGAAQLPLITGQSERFRPFAIHGTSDSDVWLTGEGISNLGGGDVYYITAWHWDGSNWGRHELTTPSSSSNYMVGNDVYAVSASDVWLTGWVSGDPTGNASFDRPVAFHFDGTSWTDRSP